MFVTSCAIASKFIICDYFATECMLCVCVCTPLSQTKSDRCTIALYYVSVCVVWHVRMGPEVASVDQTVTIFIL